MEQEAEDISTLQNRFRLVSLLTWETNYYKVKLTSGNILRLLPQRQTEDQNHTNNVDTSSFIIYFSAIKSITTVQLAPFLVVYPAATKLIW